MDNFEFDSRYARIEQENPDLKYPYAAKRRGVWCSTHNAITVDGEIARDAVCWWLAGKLPERYRYCTHNNGAMVQKWKRDDGDEWEVFTSSTDPADAIMTAWEIILGIKEKP